MIDTIRTLVEAYGPSGHESQIREMILDLIEDLADDISVDAMGNIIAWKHAESLDAARVMISSHMDEIGVMVTHVDEEGFLRFTNIGGVYTVTLVGQRVVFADGTIGSIYVENRDNSSTVPGMDQLYIDVSDGQNKKPRVKVGDAAGFQRLMEVRGRQLIAKSMDDRISCAIQIEIMRQLENSPNEIAFVFSVQEEVGLRGAQTAAYAVDPHIGIAIDVTRTGDTPKAAPMAVSLGKGPAIKVKDGRMLASPEVIDLMEKAARRASVPYQREILTGGTTDAAAMQLVRAGVRAGCLSVPCRYVHTTSETVHLDDVENGVKLMVELLSRPLTI
jgi:endoglucanase